MGDYNEWLQFLNKHGIEYSVGRKRGWDCSEIHIYIEQRWNCVTIAFDENTREYKYFEID